MSYGLSAAVVVKLEANAGRWLSVAAMAAEMHLPEAPLACVLETLYAAQMVAVQRHTNGQIGLASYPWRAVPTMMEQPA